MSMKLELRSRRMYGIDTLRIVLSMTTIAYPKEITASAAHLCFGVARLRRKANRKADEVEVINDPIEAQGGNDDKFI
jgi:hypothetical protein